MNTYDGPFYCCSFCVHQHKDFCTTSLQDFAERLVDVIRELEGDVWFAAHVLPKRTVGWVADCDQFDDAGTGYHPSEDGAKAAFWRENTFSESERERVCVYAREVEIGPDEVINALRMAFGGYSSPALGIEALA